MSDSHLGFSRIDVFVTHVFSRGIVGWAIVHNENYTVTVEGIGTTYVLDCFSWGYKPAWSS